MTGTTLQRTLIRVQQVVRGVMAIGLLLGATLAFAENAENTLLVWAETKRTKRRTSSRSSTSIPTRRTTAKSSVSYRYRQEYLELAPSATSRTMSASPATGGRWPSVACSAFCGVSLRSSSLM
jgi:hypothetical protein